MVKYRVWEQHQPLQYNTKAKTKGFIIDTIVTLT